MYENNENDCDNIFDQIFVFTIFLIDLPFSIVSLSGVYRSRRLSNFGSKHCLWVYTN